MLALASCAAEYRPQGFAAGYSDFPTAPDEAVITFHGNGYTSPERVGQMAALRCAKVTLEHGYCYFVLIGAADVSGTSAFTTPGYAQTTGSAFSTGNFATGTRPALHVNRGYALDRPRLSRVGQVVNGLDQAWLIVIAGANKCSGLLSGSRAGLMHFRASWIPTACGI
jgi:hypothetical protein